MTVFHLPLTSAWPCEITLLHLNFTETWRLLDEKYRADHVPKTMDMFLILLESYTLYGQHSSRNSAIRVGIVLEAQIWRLDLRYNRSSAFILVCVKLETYLTKSRKGKGEKCQALCTRGRGCSPDVKNAWLLP